MAERGAGIWNPYVTRLTRRRDRTRSTRHGERWQRADRAGGPASLGQTPQDRRAPAGAHSAHPPAGRGKRVTYHGVPGIGVVATGLAF